MIPVVDNKQNPLMPCSEKRARQMILSKKATPFWKKGIFCIRLNVEPKSRTLQKIAVGIDPGSKKEGLTVKSKSHTYLNIQADAVTYVKEAVETRHIMRRARRSRKTPCRKNKYNRTRGSFLSPSTKARWQWKLNIVKQLSKIYPITNIIVEDIKARTTGKRNWDASFSPLQIGKNWFYEQIKQYGELVLKRGYETKKLRDDAGLMKTKKKLSEVFEAHCVDSWVLANSVVGGHIKPDNTIMVCISQIRLHRRQLHVMRFTKGGIRKLYGGTRSCGLKRGSLVKHPKHGIVYVGGTMKNKISLHSINNGDRLSQKTKIKNIKFLSYNTWKSHLVRCVIPTTDKTVEFTVRVP